MVSNGSVGGQKIKSDKINFKSMCLALGYKIISTVTLKIHLNHIVKNLYCQVVQVSEYKNQAQLY